MPSPEIENLYTVCRDATKNILDAMATAAEHATIDKVFSGVSQKNTRLDPDEHREALRRVDHLLRERIRLLQQRLTMRGETPLSLPANIRSLLRALPPPGEHSTWSRTAPLSKRTEDETERKLSADGLLPTVAALSRLSTSPKMVSRGTSTDEVPSAVASIIIKREATLKLGPQDVSTPMSRTVLIERGSGVRVATKGLAQHVNLSQPQRPPTASWFFHTGLRPADRNAPSVQVVCNREQGVLISCPQDSTRAHATDAVHLTQIKSVLYGMSVASYRSWKEWRDSVQRKAEKKEAPDNASISGLAMEAAQAEMRIVDGAVSDQNTEALFAKRTLTIHLKESVQLQLFSSWTKDLCLIFHSLDAFNAFLAAFVDSMSYTLWSIDPLAFFEKEDALEGSIGEPAVEPINGDVVVTVDEAKFCRHWRIPLHEFVAVKQLATRDDAPVFLRAFEDLFRVASTCDYLQICAIIDFMEKAGWTSVHTVFKCL